MNLISFAVKYISLQVMNVLSPKQNFLGITEKDLHNYTQPT